MTYNSQNTILAADVANQFWNTYFATQIQNSVAYPNSGSTRSYVVPSGKSFVNAYYWQREAVPRLGNAPPAARQGTPGRNIGAGQFTNTPGNGIIRGGTGTGSIHAVLRTEVQRFSTLTQNFVWQVYRYYQRNTGPNQQFNVYNLGVRRYSTSSRFQTNPNNTIVSNVDQISTGEFNALMESFAQTYAAQRNSSSQQQSQSYTICHNSCHSSCHRNRGRR